MFTVFSVDPHITTAAALLELPTQSALTLPCPTDSPQSLWWCPVHMTTFVTEGFASPKATFAMLWGGKPGAISSSPISLRCSKNIHPTPALTGVRGVGKGCSFPSRSGQQAPSPPASTALPAPSPFHPQAPVASSSLGQILLGASTAHPTAESLLPGFIPTAPSGRASRGSKAARSPSSTKMHWTMQT